MSSSPACHPTRPLSPASPGKGELYQNKGEFRESRAHHYCFVYYVRMGAANSVQNVVIEGYTVIIDLNKNPTGIRYGSLL